MKRIKHWQDLASAAIGLWLIASPWLLGIHEPLQAIGDFVVIGSVLLAFALGTLFVPEAWEEYSELVLGVWLVASPWILEFTANRAAMQNALACGAVIVVLNAWLLLTDREYAGWGHRRTG